MVQQGDMKVELVYADTKISFKEHHHVKDGKIYVEVEPDVDYFISVERVDTNKGDILCSKFFVDEQDLGYTQSHSKNVPQNPKYKGLRAHSKGVSTHTALRFTKPSISEDGSNVNRNLMMGKVEIKVYEGVFNGHKQGHTENVSSNFAVKDVDINQSGLAKKKGLRSSQGEIVESKQSSTGQRESYKCGEHLDTITLHYCAAVGLMAVGVLKKPDPWTYQRMTRPAPAGQGPGRNPKRIRNPDVAEEKTMELFDLAGGDSDEE